MIIKCCGHCTGTNIKDIRGFTNSLIMDGKLISEPKLYYCFDCESWSYEEEKVYKIGKLER